MKIAEPYSLIETPCKYQGEYSGSQARVEKVAVADRHWVAKTLREKYPHVRFAFRGPRPDGNCFTRRANATHVTVYAYAEAPKRVRK